MLINIWTNFAISRRFSTGCHPVVFQLIGPAAGHNQAEQGLELCAQMMMSSCIWGALKQIAFSRSHASKRCKTMERTIQSLAGHPLEVNNCYLVEHRGNWHAVDKYCNVMCIYQGKRLLNMHHHDAVAWQIRACRWLSGQPERGRRTATRPASVGFPTTLYLHKDN